MARQMKDSGIEWIGEIPADWRTCKIKDVFQVVSGATPKSEQSEYWDGDIVWVTPADYKTNDKFVSSGKRTLTQAGYDSCGTTLVPAGSIVFSKRAPIGSVAVAQVPLCTNQGCLSCINRGDADTTFFYYVMSIFTEIFELYGSGTTFKELSFDSFASFAMPNPAIAEQHRIAAFLDRQCAEIDAVIERTKATIEEYKKLKQAVITEAVTKGVRGARKMKDSGIEWIGEIPEEWEVRKLKYVATILRGGSPRPIDAYLTDSPDGHNWIKIGDTTKGYKYIDGTKQKITPDGATKSRMVHKGDLLLTNSMSFGEPYILNVDGCIHDGWVAFSDYRGVDIDYLYYFLSSAFCLLQFQKQVDGGVVQNLNIDKIGSTIMMLPLVDEQREIVAYLDEKCAALDTLIAKKTALLTELETYKKSLIYEYVTGKKEVV